MQSLTNTPISDLLNDFKNEFADRLYNVGLQFCPYDKWEQTQSYGANEIIYYKNSKTRLINFYSSLVDNNIGNTPDTSDSWQKEDAIDGRQYITDEELEPVLQSNINKLHFSIARLNDYNLQKTALFLLTASYFDIQKTKLGGTAKKINSLSAKGYSVSYDTQGQNNNTILSQSVFGKEYQEIINACVIAVDVIKVGIQ